MTEAFSLEAVSRHAHDRLRVGGEPAGIIHRRVVGPKAFFNVSEIQLYVPCSVSDAAYNAGIQNESQLCQCGQSEAGGCNAPVPRTEGQAAIMRVNAVQQVL